MKITDETLYRHAAEARDISLETILEDCDLQEHQFSEAFMQEMDELIVESNKKSRRPGKRLQKIAAILAVVLIGTSSWLSMDAEARAEFTQWIRTITPAQVMYHFVGEAPEEDISDYYCSWMPEGMEASELVHSNQQGYLIYFGGDDSHCSLDYSYMHDGSAHVIHPSSEEGLRHEAVEINGMPGDFYIEQEAGHSHVLLWFDEETSIAFSLHSNLPPEDMLKIAESVEEGTVLELMPEYEFTWLPKGYDDGKELMKGSHARQISSLTDGKDLRLKYEIFEADTLEEQFWIESETPGIPLTVWGQEAVLYLNTHRDENSLLWANEEAGIAFRLDASEEQETMLTIAEAVKCK